MLLRDLTQNSQMSIQAAVHTSARFERSELSRCHGDTTGDGRQGQADVGTAARQSRRSAAARPQGAWSISPSSNGRPEACAGLAGQNSLRLHSTERKPVRPVSLFFGAVAA
jgi:hypothetical protein